MKKYILTWVIITITANVVAIKDSSVYDAFNKATPIPYVQYRYDTTYKTNIKYFLNRDSAFVLFTEAKCQRKIDSAATCTPYITQKVFTVQIDSIP